MDLINSFAFSKKKIIVHDDLNLSENKTNFRTKILNRAYLDFIKNDIDLIINKANESL